MSSLIVGLYLSNFVGPLHWAHFTDDEVRAMASCNVRQGQPGYMLTPEDRALEQRWEEVVRVAVPEQVWRQLSRQDWALAWCKGIRENG